VSTDDCKGEQGDGELVQGAASVVCDLWRDAPLHAGTIHNSHRSDLVKLLQTLERFVGLD